MTIGHWNSEYTNYRVLGNAYILFSEIVGLKNWKSSRSGNIITEVVLKTGKNLGLNGHTNSFEIPNTEYNAILKYLTSEK